MIIFIPTDNFDPQKIIVKILQVNISKISNHILINWIEFQCKPGFLRHERYVINMLFALMT